MTLVTRFAPSPTGHLHLGHAYSACSAWAFARASGGRFLLRIEDIDQTRSRPAFETAILEDLTWLALDWDGPVRRQSEHLAEYDAVLSRLIELGVVYRCFKTRREILESIASAPHGGLGEGSTPYVGDPDEVSQDEAAARIAAGEAFAWRLSSRRCADLVGSQRLHFIEETSPSYGPGDKRVDFALIGDPVLGRKDVAASYHIACTADDALQGVTHIVRGEDLYEATHLHRLLQALLGYPTPVYRHHKLLLNDEGVRLSKRDHALALKALREAGASPESVRERLFLARP